MIPWNKGKVIGDKCRKKTLWLPVKCAECGNDFLCYPSSKRKYCSTSCRSTYVAKRDGIWNKGKKTGIIPKSAFKKGVIRTRNEIRRSLMRRPMSSLEIRVQKTIDKYELPYRFVGNGDFFIEKKNPDFINVNGEKIAVEVYSRVHKDKFREGGLYGWKKERSDIFLKYGWKIIFIEDWQTNDQEYLLQLLK